MSKDSALLLIFLAPAIAPFELALLLGGGPDRAMTEKSKPHSAKTPDTPRRSEWPLITEFTYRRDYFRRWILASLLAAAVLFAVGLTFTAIAVLFLLPLQAALIHLRCPGCDTVTTLRGVTDGRRCLNCDKRLHY
jgi:hypothetical protein